MKRRACGSAAHPINVMHENSNSKDQRLLLPRLLLATHVVVAIMTVAWGVLDSRRSPASVYFSFAYWLPHAIGHPLEFVFYFLTIFLFPITSLAVMLIMRAPRTGLYLGCHCGLSIVQFMGFVPLVA